MRTRARLLRLNLPSPLERFPKRVNPTESAVVPLMTLTTILLLAAIAWLAYANGANDNFKGVATLFGAGTCSYRSAIWWAMATTLAGALFAFYLGDVLIKAFSGKGLVSDSVLADSRFLLSVACAAALTVFVASRTGFPISTTHAIVGALTGAGLIAPSDLALAHLLERFLLPLLLAPVLAIALTFVVYQAFRWSRRRLGIVQETCLCIGEREHVVAREGPVLALAQTSSGEAVLRQPDGRHEIRTGIEISLGDTASCLQRYRGHLIGIKADAAVNAAHFLSAGAVGFARGLQDNAKIVGLLVGASLIGLADQSSLAWGIVVVALMMALGGLTGARRVAETLGHKIADMNQGQGFSANLVTAFLVIGSALGGWGVSTTHCSVGALFGIGLSNGSARWAMISQIVLAWFVTLPVAGAAAFAIYAALN